MSPKSDSALSKRGGAVPTRGGKNSSNFWNTVGFHRVPVQGVTSLEGTLIRRYLGSLCSLLAAFLFEPRLLPPVRLGVQIGPTTDQGHHSLCGARVPFVGTRGPADMNRQGMTLHVAL